VQLSLGLGDDAMRIVVLGSGSGGNALVVESGDHRLMVDAGFSCREIERRLAAVGIVDRTFEGLILTHEHSDHTKGVARFSQRNRAPIYATTGTYAGLGIGNNGLNTHLLASGRTIEIGDFEVEPFAIPHDAREPIGLVIEDRTGRRVGLVADLGARSASAWRRLTDLDALVLETNHDLDMLRSGPYPWQLKQRVASENGHLSNRDAAEGIFDLDSSRLQWVVLYHLSRTNNLPGLARDEIAAALSRNGSRAEICVSDQFQPSSWLTIDPR